MGSVPKSCVRYIKSVFAECFDRVELRGYVLPTNFNTESR